MRCLSLSKSFVDEYTSNHKTRMQKAEMKSNSDARTKTGVTPLLLRIKCHLSASSSYQMQDEVKTLRHAQHCQSSEHDYRRSRRVEIEKQKKHAKLRSEFGRSVFSVAYQRTENIV